MSASYCLKHPIIGASTLSGNHSMYRYLVDKTWLDKWKKHVNLYDSLSESSVDHWPGPVDNSNFLQRNKGWCFNDMKLLVNWPRYMYNLL